MSSRRTEIWCFARGLTLRPSILFNTDFFSFGLLTRPLYLDPAHSTSGMPLNRLIDRPCRRFWYSEPYLTFGEVRLRCVGHHEIYESPVIIGV